jgi:hypothetical protein
MIKLYMAFAALALVAAAHSPAAASGPKVKKSLVTTGVDANASGQAALLLKAASVGQFDVRVRKLDRKATFEVIVGGVHVGDLVTNRGGGGKVRFRSRPRGKDLALGFDPRGETIAVRNANGDDVLVASFPNVQPGSPADVVCCIPDDSGPECEDRTADKCAAEGGTVSSAASCLPNPCVGAPPVGGGIVCCIPDDSGPECEDRTQAECMAQGGTVVQATSCAPNPCAPTPPAQGQVVCCLPDNGGDGLAECEDRTADACTAAGGTVSTATSCTPDPCNATSPPASGGDDGGHGGSGGSGRSGHDG